MGPTLISDRTRSQTRLYDAETQRKESREGTERLGGIVPWNRTCHSHNPKDEPKEEWAAQSRTRDSMTSADRVRGNVDTQTRWLLYSTRDKTDEEDSNADKREITGQLRGRVGVATNVPWVRRTRTFVRRRRGNKRTIVTSPRTNLGFENGITTTEFVTLISD